MNNTKIIRDLITRDIDEPLIEDKLGKVYLDLLDKTNAEGVSRLYKSAYKRGDWFASNYENPKNNVFNPNWLSQVSKYPDYLWIVFTDKKNVLGSSVLINKDDILYTDETQVDPANYRRGIATTYFNKILPIIKDNEITLSAYFVLTEVSSVLRKLLINKLGVVPMGIHPNILVSPPTGIKVSEISAILHPYELKPDAKLIPEAVELYNIVKDQINLPEADVVGSCNPKSYIPGDKYDEYVLSGSEPESQRELYNKGFRPIAYNPVANEITMAKYPIDGLDRINFIRDEGVEPNTKLLNYLYSMLK